MQAALTPNESNGVQRRGFLKSACSARTMLGVLPKGPRHGESFWPHGHSANAALHRSLKTMEDKNQGKGRCHSGWVLLGQSCLFLFNRISIDNRAFSTGVTILRNPQCAVSKHSPPHRKLVCVPGVDEDAVQPDSRPGPLEGGALLAPLEASALEHAGMCILPQVELQENGQRHIYCA